MTCYCDLGIAWYFVQLCIHIIEDEVMKKLKNLRTQYTREKQKMKKRKTGQGADEVYQCKWSYYAKLQFLDDFAMPQKGVSNMEVSLSLNKTVLPRYFTIF